MSRRVFRRDLARLLFAVACLPLLAGSADAQLSGLRGGTPGAQGTPGGSVGALGPLSREVAEGFIAIDGQAELRVKPTEIRVVMAVTADGPTSAECKRLVGAKTKSLSAAWRELDIPAENIVEDFIAVLPRYSHAIEQQAGQQVAVEKNDGYLMQTNMHVAVKDDAEAMRAVEAAFELDVTAIIAFDYWSKDLEDLRRKARLAAVKAARDKSDVLLGLFDERPPLINVQESTSVVYPQSLYENVANSADSEYRTSYSRRDLPQIRLFRPKNTYYRGLFSSADVHSNELPMRSEISVVSTVRLYFESPAAEHRDDDDD